MVTRSSPPWIFLREPSFVWCFPNTRDASEGRKKLSTDRAMVDEIIRHVETSGVEFPRDDSLLWVNSPSPSAFMSPNSSVMTEVDIFLNFSCAFFSIRSSGFQRSSSVYALYFFRVDIAAFQVISFRRCHRWAGHFALLPWSTVVNLFCTSIYYCCLQSCSIFPDSCIEVTYDNHYVFDVSAKIWCSSLRNSVVSSSVLAAAAADA